MIKEQYRTNVLDTTIKIAYSRIESIRNKNISRTSQRVYDKGFIGVAGAIGSFNEEELLKNAMDALDKRIEYPTPTEKNKLSLDMRKPILSQQEFIAEIRAILDELSQRQPNFIFSNKASLTEVSASMVNNEGLNLQYSDRSITLSLVFKEKSSINVFDGSIGFRERKFNRDLILDEIDIILNAYAEKVSLPKTGSCPIIFFMEDTPTGKFITDLKADAFAQGGSIFSGKHGQKLFNDGFTFGQNMNPERVYNSPFFDVEGTVNPEYTYNLIENGVIKAPYCDRKTANKYGFNRSGSAAAAYDGVPQTSLLRPYIKKTTDNIKELLGGQMGIVVLMAEGGDFTPGGDFATPVQLAMLFDGERLLGRLPEFNISSNIFRMYNEGYRGTAPITFLPFSTGELTVIEMDVAEA